METHTACFELEEDAQKICRELALVVQHPLSQPIVIQEGEKFQIVSRHAKTDAHEFNAFGTLQIDSYTEEPRFFLFNSWERDLTSGEEICWHVNLNGKETLCYVSPT